MTHSALKVSQLSRRAAPLSAAALALGISLAWTASAHAATLCVDQQSKAGCVATIAAAIAAASAGDTIYVDEGTYREDLVIGKSLSLIGEDKDNTIIDAIGLSNGVYVDGLDNPGLAQVTVSGFTIQHANFEGILVVDALDVTLYGNTVKQNDRSLQASIAACPGLPSFEIAEGANCGSGIHLLGVVHSTVSHNLVTENAGGILMTDELNTSHDNLVSHNVIKSNSFASGIALTSQTALSTTGGSRQAFGVYSNTLLQNEVVGNGFGGQGGGGIGLFTPSPGTRTFANTIVGNRVVANNQSGVLIHTLILVSSSASNPGNSDGSRNTVADNFIASNGADPAMPSPTATGVAILGISPVVDLLLSGNSIHDENVAVAITSASTLNMHLNHLGDNKIGVANLNAAGIVNATMNWWGCANGPGAGGCSGIVGGTTVLSTPWLKAPVGGDWDHDCGDRDHGWGWGHGDDGHGDDGH